MKVFKNADDLFDNLAAGMMAKPGDAGAIAATYGFQITGDGGGDWTVDCRAEPPSCTRGLRTDRIQCKIKVGADDLQKMLVDPNAAMQLYFQGRLDVSGDPRLALKLEDLFKLAG